MRIAMLGAGGPAGVNALRALDAAGHELVAFDSDERHLVWCEPYAETTSAEFDLGDDFDLVLAQPDPLVRWLVDQEGLPTFLPKKATIVHCQAKGFAVQQWEREQLRSGVEYIEDPLPDHLHLAADRFGLPFWLRAERGAGAKGAIKVDAIEQGFHWLRFWQSRGVDCRWIARDFAWSSIWDRGELVTSFARERLEYLYSHLTPEGLTGTPTIARIVHDERVNVMAHAALRCIDSEPHGIFSVDLREDVDGVVRPTEINAGRGFTTFGLWSTYDLNFWDIAVRAAKGQVWHGPRFDALPDGLTLSRHIDCGAEFTFAHELAAA